MGPTEPKVESIRSGDGAVQIDGSCITKLKFTALLTDGTIIATSEGLPGDVIEWRAAATDQPLPRGLSQALQTAAATHKLSSGAQLKLTVPAALAYGDDGCDTLAAPVPPGADIVYRVEVVDVQSAAAASAAGAKQLASNLDKDWAADATRYKDEGNRLLQRNHLDDAVATYKQAGSCIRMATRAAGADVPAELLSLHAAINANLGLAYLKLKKYAFALETLDSVLSHDPKHEKGLYRKAKALDGLTRRQEALDTVNELLTVNPGNAEGQALQHELMVKLGLKPAEPPAAVEPAAGHADVPAPQPAAASQDAQAVAAPQPAPAAAKPRKPDALAVAAKKLFKDKDRAAGLYSDVPGYDEPLPDMKQLEGRDTWWEWAKEGVQDVVSSLTCGLCCGQRRKQKGA